MRNDQQDQTGQNKGRGSQKGSQGMPQDEQERNRTQQAGQVRQGQRQAGQQSSEEIHGQSGSQRNRSRLDMEDEDFDQQQ